MKKKITFKTMSAIAISSIPLATVVSCGMTKNLDGSNILKPKPIKKVKISAEEQQYLQETPDFLLPNTEFKLSQIKRTKAIKTKPQKPAKNSFVKTPVKKELSELLNKKSINAPFYDLGFAWYQFFKHGSTENFADIMLKKLRDYGTHEVRLGFITNAAREASVKNPKFDQVYWGDDWHTNPYKEQTKELIKKHPNDIIPTIGGTLPLWTANTDSKWGRVKANNPDDIYSNAGGKIEKGDEANHFLSKIRSYNMDYAVSIGGYNNDSLAVEAIERGLSVEKLAESYNKIIELYDLHHIDFDIEGTDDGREIDYLGVKLKTFMNPDGSKNMYKIRKSREMRNEALKIVKKAHPDLRVTYTIPTFKDRMEKFNEDMIVDGVRRGLVDEVNLMAMDYAEENGVATRPGEMAMYAISAANNLKNLLMSTNAFANEEQAYFHIGLTPMNGVNDVHNEAFFLSDAAIVTNWAINKKIKFLSQWSALRDMRQHIRDERKDLWEPSIEEGKDNPHKHGMDIWTPEKINDKSVTKIQDAFSTGLNTKTLAYSKIMSGFEKKEQYPGLKDQDYNYLFGKVKSINSLQDIYNWGGVLKKQTTKRNGKEIIVNPFGDMTESYADIYNREIDRKALGYV
ncbi:MAG: hypothetical protein GY679_04550 [Mycoplasma sp.]|nr:hypothetical protein [Mycoplasma sp.]